MTDEVEEYDVKYVLSMEIIPRKDETLTTEDWDKIFSLITQFSILLNHYQELEVKDIDLGYIPQKKSKKRKFPVVAFLDDKTPGGLLKVIEEALEFVKIDEDDGIHLNTDDDSR